MKKLVLSLAVLFTVALVACDNKAKEGDSAVVADSVADTTVVAEDSAAGDSAQVTEVTETVTEEVAAPEAKAEDSAK